MWKVFMHRNFSFPLHHCHNAMDVLQMQMQHCNKYQNNQDLSLPSGSNILPIYQSCRASAIYDLPINLRYIHKRVPALVLSQSPAWSRVRDSSRGYNGYNVRPECHLAALHVVHKMYSVQIFKIRRKNLSVNVL